MVTWAKTLAELRKVHPVTEADATRELLHVRVTAARYRLQAEDPLPYHVAAEHGARLLFRILGIATVDFVPYLSLTREGARIVSKEQPTDSRDIQLRDWLTKWETAGLDHDWICTIRELLLLLIKLDAPLISSKTKP